MLSEIIISRYSHKIQSRHVLSATSVTFQAAEIFPHTAGNRNYYYWTNLKKNCKPLVLNPQCGKIFTGEHKKLVWCLW